MRPEIKIMAIVGIILCMFVFAFLPYMVQAGERHEHEPTVVNNTIVTPETVINHIIGNSGTALAIANAQHVYSPGSKKLQVNIGLGEFKGTDAISFGVGKTMGDMMFNGSIGFEDGEVGVGAGLHLRF